MGVVIGVWQGRAKLVLTESMVEIPSSYHRFGSPWRAAGNTLTDAAGRRIAFCSKPLLDSEALLLPCHLQQNAQVLAVFNRS